MNLNVLYNKILISKILFFESRNPFWEITRGSWITLLPWMQSSNLKQEVNFTGNSFIAYSYQSNLFLLFDQTTNRPKLGVDLSHEPLMKPKVMVCTWLRPFSDKKHSFITAALSIFTIFAACNTTSPWPYTFVFSFQSTMYVVDISL